MVIIIREMAKDEAKLARDIGLASFEPVECLTFSKPTAALLATVDEQIVGMASYRIFSAKGGQKVGHVETAYVRKGFEGQGIGSRLYREVTDLLKKEGCETVTAIVKDDNVASWKLFQNNGYYVVGFLEMLRLYGFIAAVRLWFDSTLAVCTGFHMWATVPQKNSAPLGQLGLFLFLNVLILLPGLLRVSLPQLGITACALSLGLLTSVLGGWLATLCSPRRWDFRVAMGGLLVSLIITAMGGIFPIVGRFYPREYEHTPEFRRAMGLEGLGHWLAILLLVIVAIVFRGQWAFGETLISIGALLLLYYSLPFYPFQCFGGDRIWNCNKVLSTVTVFISLVLHYLV
ncbi:MAG: GNAT family N-acetyltransferase [Angelakisella sp.]